MRKNWKRNRPKGFYYTSQEDFILKNGISFTKIKSTLPKSLEYEKMGECFRNAAIIAMEGKKYIYCEGLAISKKVGFPVNHAWLINKKFEVIDNTWNDGIEYFGIPFTREFLIQFLLKYKMYGLIDAWQSHWPLLQIKNNKEFLYARPKI
jgi:hypothetical protein